MNLAMCAHIILPATDRRGRVEMRKVHEVTVSQSITDVCQSATVKLPRNVSTLQREQLRTFIRRGDAIEVWLGYQGELQLEFSGYVERVGTDTPVTIELRDGLWKLLQKTFEKSYRNAHLPTVIKDIVGDAFQVNAMEATIGPVRFEKGCTVAKALKALKDEFGLATYLKGEAVHCGIVFDPNEEAVKYRMEVNVQKNDLKYRVAEDVRVQVTAKSTRRNAEPIEVKLGDEDGEQRTLNYYGIESKEELRKLAEHDMTKIKYDGYEGSFTGWGWPLMRFGGRVSLTSALYPERDGEYLAEGVGVSFSRGGFRRTIKLERRWTQ